MRVSKRCCEGERITFVESVPLGGVFKYDVAPVTNSWSCDSFMRITNTYRPNKNPGDVEAVNLTSHETTFFSKTAKVKILLNAEIVHD